MFKDDPAKMGKADIAYHKEDRKQGHKPEIIWWNHKAAPRTIKAPAGLAGH